MDGCNKKIHALLKQKSEILGQARDQKLVAEVADLERDKPKVSEYNKKEEEMTGFDPSLSLSLNDQLTQNQRTDGCF